MRGVAPSWWINMWTEGGRGQGEKPEDEEDEEDK